MTKQTITQLKNLLEIAINDELNDFKNMADRWHLMSRELEMLHDLLVEKALELKEVEYLIRLSGDETYPALFDELINSKKTKKGR